MSTELGHLSRLVRSLFVFDCEIPFEQRDDIVEVCGSHSDDFSRAPMAFVEAMHAISETLCLPANIAIKGALSVTREKNFVHYLHVENKKGALDGENLEQMTRRIKLLAGQAASKKLNESIEAKSLDSELFSSYSFLLEPEGGRNISAATRELRYQGIVALWSSIEVLIKDQLIFLFNKYPSLIERVLRSEQAKKKFELPKLSYDDLQARGFDFSSCMGDVFLGGKDFSDIGSLKAIVKALFGDAYFYAAFSAKSILRLNAMRHLIVHRRGVVDEKYLKYTGDGVDIGFRLEAGPEELLSYYGDVAELGRAAVFAFNSLYKECRN